MMSKANDLSKMFIKKKIFFADLGYVWEVTINIPFSLQNRKLHLFNNWIISLIIFLFVFIFSRLKFKKVQNKVFEAVGIEGGGVGGRGGIIETLLIFSIFVCAAAQKTLNIKLWKIHS